MPRDLEGLFAALAGPEGAKLEPDEFRELLGALGVTTALDLARVPDDWARRHLTVVGARTAAELRGPFVDHGARVAIVWDKVAGVVGSLKDDSALEHVVAVDLTAELPLTKRLALRLPIASSISMRK